MKTLIRFVMASFFLAALSTSALADNAMSTTKFTYEVKGVKLGSLSPGWMGGMASQVYLGYTGVSIGLGAYFGNPGGGGMLQDNNFGMVGIPLHVDGHLTKGLTFDLGIFGAYMQGSLNPPANRLLVTGWTLEESVAVGVVLGAGWRLSVAPGYIYNFKDTNFTGFSMGLRLEHRSVNTVTGKDD
jgi:hypothetical protein